jgi:hypothetical protein
VDVYSTLGEQKLRFLTLWQSAIGCGQVARAVDDQLERRLPILTIPASGATAQVMAAGAKWPDYGTSDCLDGLADAACSPTFEIRPDEAETSAA